MFTGKCATVGVARRPSPDSLFTSDGVAGWSKTSSKRLASVSRHTCRTPSAGMLHFLYAFEDRRPPRSFYRAVHPVDAAPGPSECQTEGPEWARALEEQ